LELFPLYICESIFITKEYTMKKIIKLTESDLTRIVKRVINEMELPIPNDVEGIVKLINSGAGTSQSKVQKVIAACNGSKFPMNTYTNKIADMIYDGINEKTMGILPSTNENMVYNAMSLPRTIDEFCGVVKSYKASYDQDLYDALNGDFDLEDEWLHIMRPLRDLGTKTQKLMKTKNTPKYPTPTGGGGTRSTPNMKTGSPRPKAPTPTGAGGN